MLRAFDILPFIVSFGGIVLDYMSTTIGLGMGFYETHPTYSPFNALIIFWSAITFLVFVLPKEKTWRASINLVAVMSYLGAFNNTLVIMGVFPGLTI